MIVTHFVLLCILMSLFKDTAGTVCSEAVTGGTQVLNMCGPGYTVGVQVVIDSYGSSMYRTNGDSINCSCTVTLTGLPNGTRTTVGFGSIKSLYPPSGCQSSITVSSKVADYQSVTSNSYLCYVLNNTFNNVQSNDTFNVTWQSGPSGSTSGYCILLTAGPGSFLSTKCHSNGTTPSPTSPNTTPTTTSTTPTTSTTSTTSTTVMTSSRTTTSTTTTTTTDRSTTITTTVGDVTSSGGALSSSPKTTTVKQDTTKADTIKDKSLDTTVIIGIAAGGVVFLVICIVIAVMCSRTKKKPNEHREPASAVANVFYEAKRVLPPEAVTNHALTPSGDIYAQVNKNSKVDTKNSREQSKEPEQEIEHVTTSSGDMYAQVEKHSKVKFTNSAEKSREPEQEIEHITTPSGDIYAQISKDANDESN